MKWAPEEFRLRGSDDFVRLDQRCAELLVEFFRWLQEPEGLAPEDASALAHAADRYLRDFLVDFMESGPTDPRPARVRQYLGNWYVVHTLEPSHGEVDTILRALSRLYTFLPLQGLLREDAAAKFRAVLEDSDFFHCRLEEFWDLTPDAIPAWRAVDDYRRDLPPRSSLPVH